MKNFIPFILAIVIVQFGFAQDQEIEGVEIISLHVPVEVPKSGRSVTVIDVEQIAQMPVTTVEEVLRFVPGFNVNSRAGFGVQSDIGMRGSTFTQVLFLIDGVRWNEPLTGHFNNTIPVPLSEIDRIEVLRGAASAIYGADAVGGVVHIQTKTFNHTRKEGVSSSGRYFLGDNALNDGDLAVGYSTDKLTISGGYKVTTSDGETFRNPNFDADRPVDSMYNTDFDIQSATLAAQYRLNDQISFNARFAQDDRDFTGKYFYTTSTFDESREFTETYTGLVSASRVAENNQQFVSLSYKETNDLFVFNPLFTPNDHNTKRYNVVANHSQTLDNGIDLTVGTQSDFQKIESTDRGDHNDSFTEAYAVGSLPLGEDFHSIVSLRGGYNSIFGWSFSPQASIAYIQKNYSVRASAGRSIRTADYTERFNGFLLVEPSEGRNLGNPDLEEETAFTVDLGIDYLVNENHRFSLTSFYRDSDDLIDFVLTNSSEINNVPDLLSNTNYLFATNIADAQTFGIEFQTLSTWNFSENVKLNTDLNYTFLNTEVPSNLESKYINDHPNHQANLNLNLDIQSFNFNLMNQFINRESEEIPVVAGNIGENYFVSHARVGYQFNQSFGLNLRMNNVFDQNYQEIIGAQMPGRWFSAGFQWDLY